MADAQKAADKRFRARWRGQHPDKRWIEEDEEFFAPADFKARWAVELKGKEATASATREAQAHVEAAKG